MKQNNSIESDFDSDMVVLSNENEANDQGVEKTEITYEREQTYPKYVMEVDKRGRNIPVLILDDKVNFLVSCQLY